MVYQRDQLPINRIEFEHWASGKQFGNGIETCPIASYLRRNGEDWYVGFEATHRVTPGRSETYKVYALPDWAKNLSLS